MMKLHATVSIVPIQVTLDLPDSTPVGEVRDRVIEEARHLIANNGAEHVILASNHPELPDGLAYLGDLGFPVLTEYVQIVPPEPDPTELAEVRITRTYDRRREDDEYKDGMPVWMD